MLSWNAATAQPPVWVAGPVPPGELYGYSPLVHSIEPFPSKTSPYSYSMFIPGVGGKRVYPSLVTDPRRRCPAGPAVVEVRHAPRTAPTVLPAAYETAGPVARPRPAQGLSRFGR
jgi:hypothetical protein